MEDVRLAPTAREALSTAREQLEALLQQIAVGGQAGRKAADRLPAALTAYAASAPPSDCAAYFRQMLEAGALDGRSDSTGLPCKAALIQAQVALGFPHALEVNPDDLAWLRATAEAQQSRPTASRIGTSMFALLSMGWSATVLNFLGGNRGSDLWLSAPFVVGGMHGLVALLAAILASPSLPLEGRLGWRTLYRFLNRMVWLGPAFTLVPMALVLADRSWRSDTAATLSAVALVGLACAAPAMLTAVACGVAGRRLVPEDEDQPKEPR